MRHIKRNVFRESKRTISGIQLAKKGTTISFYKEEPFIGYAYFGGKTWVVERGKGEKWVINDKYSKMVQADEKRPARMKK